jgi:CheY-like chemotaxis protein
MCSAARSSRVNRPERSGNSDLALDDELRACLASIVGSAVQLDSDDPAARREAPRRIVESVQQLTETLERIQASGGLASEDAALAGGKPKTRRRVVVVDEDPVSRNLVKRMLPSEFEVLEAGDRESALQLAGMENVEFFVLAWRAAAFSGPETLAELKTRYPNLPLLVIGDSDDSLYEEIAGLLGADKFLTRPLNSLDLLAAADKLR